MEEGKDRPEKLCCRWTSTVTTWKERSPWWLVLRNCNSKWSGRILASRDLIVELCSDFGRY